MGGSAVMVIGKLVRANVRKDSIIFLNMVVAP